MKKILENKIECVHCGFILRSTSVHDYRTHHCDVAPKIPEVAWDKEMRKLEETGVLIPPMIAADGGNEYLKRAWSRGNPSDYFIERSVYEE